MSGPRIFRINGPAVICEIIEGEAILVNRDNGHYFSVSGAGVDILRGLMSGGDPERITADLAVRREAPAARIESAVRDFLTELEKEKLIVRADGGNTPPLDPGQLPKVSGSKTPFEPPRLQKFTDVEDLLKLDPIHEVDKTGWPSPKAPPPSG